MQGPVRRVHGRMLYGVASGIAAYAGVDPLVVRTAFGLLSLAGGIGIVLYIGLALVMPQGAADERESQTRVTAIRPLLSVALITGGLLLIARAGGFWFGDALVGPIALAALGAAVLWARSDTRRFAGSDAPSNPFETLFQGRVSPMRVIGGAALIVVGAITFLAANTDPYGPGFDLISLLMLPIVATVAGLLLIFGPWLYRLAAQLTDERLERIRSEERSALAAHLHDSVLQTLALIQRSDSPHRMAHLARTQERELRAWLFGTVGAFPDETLASALEALAGRCEARYEVNVDVVVVGDAPIDDRLSALLGASGEAINNAAVHSRSNSVSVYAETEDDVVTVYVRDEGRGFDPAAVPGDRRGIRDSIDGRMRRVGGSAVIHSEIGNGTEVTLTMPLRS